MSQTTNKQYQDKYVSGQITRSAGLVTDTIVSEDTGTLKNEDLVIKGTAKKGALLPVAAFVFDDIAGIVIRDPAKAQTFRTGGISYEENDPVAVLRKGYMAITLTQAVSKGDKLFFVHTVGASAVHTWRKDLDTAKASKAPVEALEAGSIGDVIEVLVNLDMGIGIV
jgi:hypothetical protein